MLLIISAGFFAGMNKLYPEIELFGLNTAGLSFTFSGMLFISAGLFNLRNILNGKNKLNNIIMMSACFCGGGLLAICSIWKMFYDAGIF
jgi:hypothetical protein